MVVVAVDVVSGCVVVVVVVTEVVSGCDIVVVEVVSGCDVSVAVECVPGSDPGDVISVEVSAGRVDIDAVT